MVQNNPGLLELGQTGAITSIMQPEEQLRAQRECIWPVTH